MGRGAKSKTPASSTVDALAAALLNGPRSSIRLARSSWAHGEKRAFKPSRSKFIYLDIDGRQYWTMGAPLSNTIILNRAWLNWEDRLEAGEDPESIAKNDPPQRQAESA